MYSRKYNGGRIEVRQPSKTEIDNGYFSEREWIFTANSVNGHHEGIAYSKFVAIESAKAKINQQMAQ